MSLFAHIKAVSMQEHAHVRLLYFLHNRKINQQVKAARGGACEGFLPGEHVRTRRFYKLVTYDLIAKQNNSFHAQGLPLCQVCVRV